MRRDVSLHTQLLSVALSHTDSCLQSLLDSFFQNHPKALRFYSKYTAIAPVNFLHFVFFTLPACPNCASRSVLKSGCIHNGKQNHRCQDYRRQFIEEPQQKPIDDATRAIIDDLLLKRISMAGIVSVAKESEQQYAKEKYAGVRLFIS